MADGRIIYTEGAWGSIQEDVYLELAKLNVVDHIGYVYIVHWVVQGEPRKHYDGNERVVIREQTELLKDNTRTDAEAIRLAIAFYDGLIDEYFSGGEENDQGNENF